MLSLRVCGSDLTADLRTHESRSTSDKDGRCGRSHHLSFGLLVNHGGEVATPTSTSLGFHTRSRSRLGLLRFDNVTLWRRHGQMSVHKRNGAAAVEGGGVYSSSRVS